MQSYKTRRRIYICFQLVQVTDCSRARFGWAAASLHIQIRSFLGLFSKWASMQMTVGERILLQGFSRMLWNMFFVWHKKKELVPPGVNSLQHPWIQPDNSCHLLSIRKLQMSSSCLDGVSKTDYISAAKRKCWRVRFCEQLINMFIRSTCRVRCFWWDVETIQSCLWRQTLNVLRPQGIFSCVCGQIKPKHDLFLVWNHSVPTFVSVMLQIYLAGSWDT